MIAAAWFSPVIINGRLKQMGQGARFSLSGIELFCSETLAVEYALDHPVNILCNLEATSRFERDGHESTCFTYCSIIPIAYLIVRIRSTIGDGSDQSMGEVQGRRAEGGPRSRCSVAAACSRASCVSFPWTSVVYRLCSGLFAIHKHLSHTT